MSARPGRVARLTLLGLAVAATGCGVANSVPGGAADLPKRPATAIRYRPAPTDAPAAPPIRGKLIDGSTFDAAALWSDRAVALIFFSSWCDTCARRQDALSALARRLGDKVVFVGVDSGDDKEQLAGYIRAHRVPYPVVSDPDRRIWGAYAVADPPAVVLIAKGGQLLRGWTAGVDARTLERQLRQLVLPG